LGPKKEQKKHKSGENVYFKSWTNVCSTIKSGKKAHVGSVEKCVEILVNTRRKETTRKAQG
jgi:hypothetical protein